MLDTAVLERLPLGTVPDTYNCAVAVPFVPTLNRLPFDTVAFVVIETPPALCSVVAPAIVDPIVTFVVLEAVALVPMLMVWVAEPPAAAPMEMVFVAVEFPRTIPPVLLLVPMV